MPRTLFGADIFCPAVDNFSEKDLKLFGNDRKGLEIKQMLLGSTILIP